MAIKTCTGATSRPYVHVEVRLSQNCTITATGVDAPLLTTATGDVTGAYTITLWANNDLTPTSTYYTVTEYLGATDNTFTIQVPTTAGPFTMSSILVTAPTASPSPNHVSTLIVDGVPGGVAINAAGDIAARSVTVSSTSPNTATLPGVGAIPALPTPAGVVAGQVWEYSASSGAVYNVMSYSAKGDAKTVTDAAITTGQPTLTSATAVFTVLDVGKVVGIVGAGAAGVDLVTTILAFVNSTTVTLAANAGTSVSAVFCVYGTDDTIPIQAAALATIRGGKVKLPSLKFITTKTLQFKYSNAILEGDEGSTIYFLPTSPYLSNVNDRVIDCFGVPVGGGIVGIRQCAAGALALGATSFVAQSAGDTADLVKGDWLQLSEYDALAVDIVVSDWVQVQSVAGTTVNLQAPLRQAFPNSRAFSGTVPLAGLTFTRLTPLFNVTFKDFQTVQLNNGPVTFQPALGLAFVRRGLISNVSVSNPNGQGLYTYRCSQIRVAQSGAAVSALAPSEFAATVDLSIMGCNFGNEGQASAGYLQSTYYGLTLDFGTAFFSVIGNQVAGSGLGCIYLQAVQEGTVIGNTGGWVRDAAGSSGIVGRGAQRVTIVGNNLVGGSGTGVAVTLGPSVGYTVNILPNGNVVDDINSHNFSGSSSPAVGSSDVFMGPNILPSTAFTIAHDSSVLDSIGIWDFKSGNARTLKIGPGVAGGSGYFGMYDTTGTKLFYSYNYTTFLTTLIGGLTLGGALTVSTGAVDFSAATSLVLNNAVSLPGGGPILSATGANILGLNYNAGGSLVYYGGTAVAKVTMTTGGGLGVWGHAAPGSQPVAITAPTAPSVGYVQAEATSMKTAVDAIRAALTGAGLTA